jgi:hypothetical protein
MYYLPREQAHAVMRAEAKSSVDNVGLTGGSLQGSSNSQKRIAQVKLGIKL